MKRNISPFSLGLFVLLSFLAGLGAILWIGAASLFKPKTTYVTYFDQSVQGLQQGAPVRYLGVDVGQVASVALAPKDRRVEVKAQIEGNFRLGENFAFRLASPMFAGQTFLVLEQISPGEGPSRERATSQEGLSVIPSVEGGQEDIMGAAQDLVRQVGKADIQGLVKEWKSAGGNLSDVLKDPDIDGAIENVRAASEDLRAILAGLGGPGAREEWQRIANETGAAVEDLRTAARIVSSQLEDLPPEAVSDITRQLESAVRTGEKAIASWDDQVDQSLDLMERSLLEVERVLNNMDQLVRSLRREPGRVLTVPRTEDPFER